MVRTWTPETHAIVSQVWPGFNNPNNIVTPNNTPRECNNLTMNSVAALMTSHNIVAPNNTLRE